MARAKRSWNEEEKEQRPSKHTEGEIAIKPERNVAKRAKKEAQNASKASMVVGKGRKRTRQTEDKEEKEENVPQLNETGNEKENKNETRNGNGNKEEAGDNVNRPMKRTRAARLSKPAPEYFPEKRNMEDLWKSAFPVGTEWDQMEGMYNFEWKFQRLEKAFEEGGLLSGQKVYIFGCSEPQLVPFKEKMQVIQIPVVVVVVSPFSLSNKIGIKSVQMEGETIVPMKQLKMDWVPYVPNDKRVALKRLNKERIKKYEYCLPYFYQPLKEDEMELDTIVPIIYPTEPPVVCDFDWEFDDFEEFTNNLVEEEVLTKENKDDFKNFLIQQVKEKKQQQHAEKEVHKKAIEEMSPETKEAFENIQFYKFYPDPNLDVPDISHVKVPFINRYYGKANEVF